MELSRYVPGGTPENLAVFVDNLLTHPVGGTHAPMGEHVVKHGPLFFGQAGMGKGGISTAFVWCDDALGFIVHFTHHIACIPER